MSTGLRRIPFRVDMAGVIEVMGKSLYSTRSTPIRELVQNAHDGVRRRRMEELDFIGSIRVLQDPVAGTLTFEDDGIGLDEAEAEKFLGTVGISLTGQVKRSGAGASGLIGQFGIGLLSSFLIATTIRVESSKGGRGTSVTWIAGEGSDILIGAGDRVERGTAVTITLRKDALRYAEDAEYLEVVLREYAEFLEVPILLGEPGHRVNCAEAAWLAATPEPADLRTELEHRFGESPLSFCSFAIETPIRARGALYVTSERTPGFTSEPAVHVTLHRMLISKSVRDLVPRWAGFLRGLLELTSCTPTASREDLVRDQAFSASRDAIDEQVHGWLERMARENATEWQAVLAWHRYTLTGSALDVPRLRALLARTLPWNTTAGPLVFDAILERSAADPLAAEEFDHVVWFNSERQQERWLDQVFEGREAICVHATRSFELSLLTAMVRDAARPNRSLDLRPGKVSSRGFAESVLWVRENRELDPEWTKFLGVGTARVFAGRLDGQRPCLAFVDERRELLRTFEEVRDQKRIPAGFQALIERELADAEGRGNEILLDLAHPLVSRALARSTSHPLASMLRIQVLGALESAGARTDATARRQRDQDLDWVADALP